MHSCIGLIRSNAELTLRYTCQGTHESYATLQMPYFTFNSSNYLVQMVLANSSPQLFTGTAATARNCRYAI